MSEIVKSIVSGGDVEIKEKRRRAEEVAHKVWQIIEDSAAYSFN